MLQLEGVERGLRDEWRGLVDVVLLPACYGCACVCAMLVGRRLTDHIVRDARTYVPSNESKWKPGTAACVMPPCICSNMGRRSMPIGEEKTCGWM